MKTNSSKPSTCNLQVFVLFFILHSSFFISFGQAPNKISYQAVIRDAGNELVSNQQVGMKISILQGSESGTVVYAETHTPTTNANGLISVIVGNGTVVDGNIATINWGTGTYFLKSETDATGGTTYSITIINQILSVPYALHAKTAESVTETDPFFSAWNKSTGISITESQISDLGDYIESETDPVFSAWNKSTGISITESQISDLGDYIESESDPVFSAWNKSTGISITESQISDLGDYIESETDPVFSAWNKSTGISITESQISDLGDYIESESDPVFSAWNKSTGISITESQISDLGDYIESESDPVFSAWNKSIGISITESQISDLGDYIESESDPVFSAWNKSIGISITESQISDLGDYIESESDPVFSAWNKSIGISITESQISDLGDYIESESDPVFSAWNKSTGISITESQISDLGNYIETETDPAVAANFDFSGAIAGDLLQFNGTKWVKVTPNYLTSYTETDPTWNGAANQTGDIVRTGNVGIGVNTPDYQLHVADDIGANTGAFGSSPNTVGIGIDFFGGDVGLFDIKEDKMIAGKDYITGIYQFGGTFGANEGIIIKNNNVGIGTISPITQFHTTGSVRFEGAGIPGIGKVLTSDAIGNATWEHHAGGGSLPVGVNGQTIRHDGANWIANDLLKNNGVGIGINAEPIANTKLFVNRPETSYGAGHTNIFAYRTGNSNPANGGTLWSLTGIDASILGYSGYGNNFSAAIAGYSYLDYENSTAVIGSNANANTFGALAFRDENNRLFGGYFKGDVNVTGTLRIQGGTPGTGKVLTSDASGNATWVLPSVLPSGNNMQTIRHDGTNWTANSVIRNNGIGIGIYANPIENTQLYIYRPESNLHGAGRSSLYALTGIAFEPNMGGTNWFLNGVDAAIKGYSVNGNRFTAAIAGYSSFISDNSAAVIGSDEWADLYGALAFKDANNNSWAGYFKGDVHISGKIGIGTSNPSAQLHTTGTVRFSGAGTPGNGKILTSDANGTATWQQGTRRYQVGDHVHGGVVIFVEPCGTKGVVVRIRDEMAGAPQSWIGGNTYYYTYALGNGVYSGEMNTSIIVSIHTAKGDANNYAARLCSYLTAGSSEGGQLYGYGDWYLPSKDELNLIKNQKEIINNISMAAGGTALQDNYYWSSTESNHLNAWALNMDHYGMNSPTLKGGDAFCCIVRCVRSF